MNVSFDITGYILSGLGIGGIIGSIISSYILKLANFNIILISVNILRVFVFLGFLIYPTPWGYFIFFIFKAILGGVWNVCYNIYTIGEIPHTHITRVSALNGLVIQIFTAIAGLLAGYLINSLGVNYTLYFLVFLTVGMFLYTINVKNANFNYQ
ncbi:H+ Antiporter protein [[Pasteurella] mairii]|uniref:H+ Antiporter protein n=1 Tax=[Pasteurella] mairii TaxID=757 RepID=A0A379B4G8_9PAST|nr:H+ Antiporter protein [[Pasteurella] mairii]